MPLFTLIALIVLPSIEIYLLFSWIADSPLWALLYLIFTIIVGVGFLRLAKVGFLGYLPQLRNLYNQGAHTLLLLAKLWLVGILLIFPGYITDIIALALLLFIHGGGGKKTREGEVLQVRGRVIEDD